MRVYGCGREMRGVGKCKSQARVTSCGSVASVVPDDAKRFIVVQSSDYDRHGACLQPLEDALRIKNDALVAIVCVLVTHVM